MAPGDQQDHWHRVISGENPDIKNKNKLKLTRAHQESLEPIQEASEMPQELAEQLFIPFHEKVKRQLQGHSHRHAGPIGGLFGFQSPSDRITHTGAMEISLSDSHPKLRLNCFASIFTDVT